jgi:assimilatory nitrate reductase electron transfer subunit
MAASTTAAPVATSPTSMPERFTVCRCNGVTKADLVRAWHAGDRTAPEMAARTRVTTGCGGCTDVVAGIVEWLAASDPVPDASQPAQPGRDISVSSAKQTEHHLETSHS